MFLLSAGITPVRCWPSPIKFKHTFTFFSLFCLFTSHIDNFLAQNVFFSLLVASPGEPSIHLHSPSRSPAIIQRTDVFYSHLHLVSRRKQVLAALLRDFSALLASPLLSKSVTQWLSCLVWKCLLDTINKEDETAKMTSKSFSLWDWASLRVFLCWKLFSRPTCWAEFLTSFCRSWLHRKAVNVFRPWENHHKLILMQLKAQATGDYIGVCSAPFFFFFNRWLWILQGEVWVKLIPAALRVGKSS